MAIIVLDPGHGGTTTVGGSSPNNATGPNGLKEKTATLSVALAAERALSSSGADVILTRRTDQNLGIVDRASVAKDNRADVFVSIHFNAPGGSAPAQGTETWIGTGHTAKSLELAKIVQDQVVAATGYRDRGVKVGNVSGVIKPANHRSKTANCLVEISFLSLQAEEEARLRDPAYIEELGTAIAAAATTYLGIGGPMTLASAASALSEPEDGASARRMGFIPPDDEDESLDMEVLDLAGDAEIERVAGARWQDLDAFERMTESAPEAGKTVPLGAMAAPQINFGPNAKEADVTIHARGVLRDVMTRAGLATVTVSSTARSPADQARVMYNNLVTYGVAHQKALYADPGDRVIDVYAAGKAAGKSAARIKAEMEAKIIAIGPTRVSRHASDPAVLCVFDVAPSSVANRAAFEREIRNEGRISKHIFPPGDPGYHFEIPPGA
jgi:N-acetylmuramoyl-L-alanine amidase